MQAVSATLILIINIAMLNWFLNKIFNGFQIRTKILLKFQNIIESQKNRKVRKFYLKIKEKLLNFKMRNMIILMYNLNKSFYVKIILCTKESFPTFSKRLYIKLGKNWNWIFYVITKKFLKHLGFQYSD